MKTHNNTVSKMLSLKEMCMQKMVKSLTELPPLLFEEVFGKTIEMVTKDVENKVILNINTYAVETISDIKDVIIQSQGLGWRRPESTLHINDNLYQTFVNIADDSVNNDYQLV